MTPEKKPMSLGDKLQMVPKWALYLILITVTSLPLFLEVRVPNKPVESTVDLFAKVMSLQQGDVVLIGSDWTNSTRGESGGEFQAIVRILMRKGVKFAVYATADPQAPQVATDAMAALNAERKAKGEPEYARYRDWVNIGYFPNSEGENQAIGRDVRAAFAGRTDTEPGKAPADVWQSPVMKDMHKLSDFKMLLLISASNTDTITIERIGGKLPIGMLVTGVMVPQEQVYYQSGQLFGLCGGVKGVYDLEWMMEYGVNMPNPNTAKSEKYGKIEGFPGMKNFDTGAKYNFALHFALTLLIVVVALGNVGMILSRREKKQ